MLINAKTPEPIEMIPGIRQGDSPSPILFNLVLEKATKWANGTLPHWFDINTKKRDKRASNWIKQNAGMSKQYSLRNQTSRNRNKSSNIQVGKKSRHDLQDQTQAKLRKLTFMNNRVEKNIRWGKKGRQIMEPSH